MRKRKTRVKRINVNQLKKVYRPGGGRNGGPVHFEIPLN